MTAEKRYEILEALPTYGPMYIPVTENGEPFYSQGLAVRFRKSDGTSWVANFEPGLTELNAVYEFTDQPRLLVIAGGACYIMNPDQSKPIAVFGFGYVAVFKALDNLLVLQDQNNITIIESNGEYWDSEKISWDGLKDLKLDRNLITGLSYDPIDDADEWIEFTYDLATKTLNGGSYKRNELSKKPWWKLW